MSPSRFTVRAMPRWGMVHRTVPHGRVVGLGRGVVPHRGMVVTRVAHGGVIFGGVRGVGVGFRLRRHTPTVDRVLCGFAPQGRVCFGLAFFWLLVIAVSRWVIMVMI
jgi:hypothetical protein